MMWLMYEAVQYVLAHYFSEELPESVVILSFKGNPCTENDDYRYVLRK